MVIKGEDGGEEVGVRIHFLGGAAEVGASCLVIEAAGRRILVDAGIRMHAPDRLPDLSRLQDLGGIDGVVVTHAHADHIGALPLAAGAFPAAPVVATPATAGLMGVMLEDAVRIGEAKADAEGDLPPYGRPQVSALLERLRPLPFGHPLPLLAPIGEPNWLLTFFPAGHVLGAAMALLDTPEGSVLAGGDVSIAPQLTVGPAVPPRQRVDYFVLESTYGNRLHSERAAEETRLVGQIQEIIARGGHCLIPAFALGRAQEILMILAAARRRGAFGAPVWVDGLVRSVCGVYQAYAESGSPALRRLVARQGNPFFSADGPVRPVERPNDRSEILAGPPAVIVASSGMLSGGPSVYYAARLAGDERNGILLTGYQDEEAPGRRLLELTQLPADDRRLTLGGDEIPVRCAVSRYNLSAHADGDELAALAERVRPALTCLVHGDGEARLTLAEKLIQQGLACYQPANGEVVELASRPARQNAVEKPSPTADQLVTLTRATHVSRGWTALELAERYYGRATAEGVEAVGSVLSGSDQFVPDRIRPMVYRVAPPKPAVNTQAWGPVSQERARQRLDETFGGDSTLVKAGLYLNERRIELRFQFPDVARERYARVVKELEAELGWDITFRPTPDQGALQSAALRLLPDGLHPAGAASVHLDQRTVELRVLGEIEPRAAERAAAGFRGETGYNLILRNPDELDGEESLETNESLAPPAASEPTPSDLGRLEQNLAFSTIRESLELDGAEVFKLSRRGDSIEVAFLTPLIGERFQPQLKALEASLGWALTYARQPQQGALIEVVRQIIGRPLAKTPSVFPIDEFIRVRLAPGETPSAEEVTRWREEVREASGFELEVESN
jgi:Cft2 family RNA processing exonuclease